MGTSGWFFTTLKNISSHQKITRALFSLIVSTTTFILSAVDKGKQ